jgi:hypothetical protein
VREGDEFELRGYLRVQGPAGTAPFAGFTVVLFDPGFASPVTKSNESGFLWGKVNDGELDEAGRIMYWTAQAELIFSKTFKATKSGLATFSTNPADDLGHEILVLGLNQGVPLSQVTFGSATLQIRNR